MNIDRIIGRFLLGKQSQDELKTLEQWKTDAQENLKELQGIQQLWRDSQGLQDYQDFNVDSALAKLESTLSNDKNVHHTGSKVKSLLSLKWISGIAASFLILFLGYQYMVTQQTTVVGSNRTVHLLADGSSIEVADGSDLILADSNEKVFKLKGSAYFEIEKQENTQIEILTDYGEIIVVGTAFAVQSTDDYTTVSVSEGKVNFNIANGSFPLTAGMTASFDGQSMTVHTLSSVNFKSQVTGKLIYDSVPLYQVVNDLNRHFGNKILLSEEESNFGCKVSSVFSDLVLADILQELSLTIGLKFHKEENKYVIDSVSC